MVNSDVMSLSTQLPVGILPFQISMSNRKPKIVVIGGPTASGKTSVGIETAIKCGGEIVSADSIQIYRHMDIGSAKPSQQERRLAPHHMIDVRNPDEDFSLGDYVHEARQAISDILARGKLPFVVGGTGLYIRGLLGGIVDLPPSDPEIRERLWNEEQEQGEGTLFEKLMRIDPQTASRIPRTNVQRIVRALEIFELTGEKMSELLTKHRFQDQPYDFIFLCLSPDRKILYERIDIRVDSMLNEGLLEEVCNLYKLGYPRGLKALQSLGYRHAGMILEGEMDRDEAIRLMKRDTRRYAKRQFTWFRSEPPVIWKDPTERDEIEYLITNFLGS